MDCTVAEFRVRSKFINRIENPATSIAALYSNIKQFNGHLMPVVASGDIINKL